MTTRDAAVLTAALRVYEDRFVFNDVASARSFAEAYLACDERCWSNPRTIRLVHAHRGSAEDWDAAWRERQASYLRAKAGEWTLLVVDRI
jgi:hypothetical protein